MLHIVGDAGGGGALAHVLGIDPQSTIFQHCTGHHGIPACLGYRAALTGHGSFVDVSLPAEHCAVDLDDHAGGDDHRFTHLDFRRWDQDLHPVPLDPDLVAGGLEQFPQHVVGSPRNRLFQIFAELQHEGGGVGREIIAAAKGDGNRNAFQYMGGEAAGEQFTGAVAQHRQRHQQGERQAQWHRQQVDPEQRCQVGQQSGLADGGSRRGCDPAPSGWRG
ncbi:hypothetical protein D3C79_588480 [compost metagenome]